MNYEDKMRMMKWVKPEQKDVLLAKLAKGEVVDITKDADLFFTINRDRMPMEEQVNRSKYNALANHVKNTREVISDKEYGQTQGKKMRYLGEIPADIYFTHPWFSPTLPKHERDANIRKFLNMFPAFRIGSKQA